MNINTLDLNLLRLFAAIYRSGSVGQAAEQLCLSQPATSNALARLRQAFGDELFVRSRQGMIPTPEAERIAPQLLLHLDGIYASLSDGKAFDPASSTQVFNLSLSGLGEANFLPSLASSVMQAMPNGRLTNKSLALPELLVALEQGNVDLAIGMFGYKDRGICHLPLFHDKFTAIYGAGLSNPNTAKVEHCKLILCEPSATFAKELEQEVQKAGLMSNVVLNIRHFSGLGELLNNLDAVAVVPEQLVDNLNKQGQFGTLDWPNQSDGRTVNMVWHQRTENDPANQWLREQAKKLFLKLTDNRH